MSDVSSEKQATPDGQVDLASPETDRSSVKEIDLARFEEVERRHVLVVEDDPVILYLLQDVLTAAGYRVLIAKNASDGLKLFQTYAKSTFCVILDYGIPGMHAARLMERMQDTQSDVKVVLSSGYPQNFIREDFPIEKLAGFLAKPYDPQVLITELNTLEKTKFVG